MLPFIIALISVGLIHNQGRDPSASSLNTGNKGITIQSAAALEMLGGNSPGFRSQNVDLVVARNLRAEGRQ
jgi:hypothetical protein